MIELYPKSNMLSSRVTVSIHIALKNTNIKGNFKIQICGWKLASFVSKAIKNPSGSFICSVLFVICVATLVSGFSKLHLVNLFGLGTLFGHDANKN